MRSPWERVGDCKIQGSRYIRDKVRQQIKERNGHTTSPTATSPQTSTRTLAQSHVRIELTGRGK